MRNRQPPSVCSIIRYTDQLITEYAHADVLITKAANCTLSILLEMKPNQLAHAFDNAIFGEIKNKVTSKMQTFAFITNKWVAAAPHLYSFTLPKYCVYTRWVLSTRP